MEIILVQKVAKLGNIGDVVNVKTGYARNYLLKKHAVVANKKNMQWLEQKKQDLESKQKAKMDRALEVAEMLKKKNLKFVCESSEEGLLYGSISASNIVQKLGEQDVIIEKEQVMMQQPIKKTGMHKVEICLGHDINTTVKVIVVGNKSE